MDDWGGLENRCGLWATVGSNPTLSAIFSKSRYKFAYGLDELSSFFSSSRVIDREIYELLDEKRVRFRYQGILYS